MLVAIPISHISNKTIINVSSIFPIPFRFNNEINKNLLNKHCAIKESAENLWNKTLFKGNQLQNYGKVANQYRWFVIHRYNSAKKISKKESNISYQFKTF